METTRVLFAGGFPGSGKTALLWEAALRLTAQGLRVGLITNDPSSGALLAHSGLRVEEVDGNGFGGNFNGLTAAVGRLRAEIAADVILVEPSGRSADLSATVIQPLKQLYGRKLPLGPLSVLADPVRLNGMLRGGTSGLHPGMAYIFRKQLEESDIILVTRTDAMAPEALRQLIVQTRAAYHSCVMAVSPSSGDGIDGWLQEAMMRHECGTRIAAVDYDAYARGNAAVSRLDGMVRLRGKTPSDWDLFTRLLLAKLRQGFEEQACPVEHVKILVENGDSFVAGSLTDSVSGTLSFRGSAGMGDCAKLTVGACVETPPGALSRIVRETLDAAFAHHSHEAETDRWECLPSECPAPACRFDKVVKMPVLLKGLRMAGPAEN
ncbi:MAG: cobalamin synthesis protein P47K [Tannerella sp.]|jgi:hypothetical protein|nr:cobalamin synthesis protein P47K [Tannerella sp.]